MKKNNLFFQVGNICYKIQCDKELIVNPLYTQFFVHNPSVNYIINCNVVITNSFKSVNGNIVYHGSERIVFDDNGIETRVHFFNNEPFGIYREIDEYNMEIEVIQNEINIVFLELFNLEKYLLKTNSLVLHSSFIKWNDKGIVFTAPSGTGKSTQANLWNKYENAEIINGDRSVLILNDDYVEVCGLPFCGSSGINLNKRVKLNSIVFISQAKENKVTLVNKDIATLNIYKEVSVNYWNADYVNKTFEIIDKLVHLVKSIDLKCTISNEAVNVLKEKISVES